MSSPSGDRPRRALPFLRVALLVVPVAWLATKTRVSDIAASASLVGAKALLSAMALVVACFAFGALRWSVLLRAYGAADVPPVSTLFRHILVGHYFNLLPGGVVGEAVRAHRVRAFFDDVATTYLVAVVDRMMGLVGLLLMAPAAIASGPLPSGFAGAALQGAVAVAVLLAAAVIGAPAALGASPALARRVAALPVVGPPLSALRPPKAYGGLFVAAALSVCTQGAVMGAMTVLVTRLAPAADVLTVVRVSPLVVLVVFIPLTPAGIGQREAAFVEMFGWAGAPPSACVAASLLYFALGTVVALAGGAVLAWEGMARRAEPPPQE